MASVHDVAAYILEKQGPMSSMKLQKLVYYSQAWHLVWDEVPLFPEPIEAWANGPVVHEVFTGHRGKFTVDAPWRKGESANLTSGEQETVDIVLANYGDLSGRQLSALTHAEAPWRAARGNLPDTAWSRNEITKTALATFYGALDASDSSEPVSQVRWAQ